MHIDPITGFVHHNGSVYTMPMWEAKLEQDAQRAECEASEQKRKDEARAAYEAAVQATLDSAEARKQEALNRHREEVEESRARYRAVCAELKAEVRASRRVQARLSGLIQDYS